MKHSLAKSEIPLNKACATPQCKIVEYARYERDLDRSAICKATTTKYRLQAADETFGGPIIDGVPVPDTPQKLKSPSGQASKESASSKARAITQNATGSLASESTRFRCPKFGLLAENERQ